MSLEIFQKRINQALKGVLDITDDTLKYEEANADHDWKLLKLLERCKSHGIALNPDKLKLPSKSVTFIGHVQSNESIKVHPEKPRATTEMPRPPDMRVHSN